MNREKFEALPEISEQLQFIDGFDGFKYHSINNHRSADWLNGAYYAYCEQEKVIQMQECGVKSIIEIIDSITPYEYDLDTMGKINKIKELLK